MGGRGTSEGDVTDRLAAVGRWFWLLLFFAFVLGSLFFSALLLGGLVAVALVRLHGARLDDGPPLDLWAPIAAASAILPLLLASAVLGLERSAVDAMRTASLGLGYAGIVSYHVALRRWCADQGWHVSGLEERPRELLAIGTVTTAFVVAFTFADGPSPTWATTVAWMLPFANIWCLYRAAQSHWTLIAGLAKGTQTAEPAAA